MTARHVIAGGYYPTFASALPGWLRCSCGVTVTVEPNRRLPDPWEPLVEAWRAHRAAVGLSTPTDAAGPLTGEGGWDGTWSHTAIGNSRRSARERGLMGVAAKRAKAGVKA